MERKFTCKYPIVISKATPIENELQITLALFELGLERFHLRKPSWGLSEARTFLRQIPQVYHNRIVIHQNWELLNEFQLYGVHLTQGKANLKLDHPLIVSTSCHCIEEFNDLDPKFSYAFLSPFFPSISKPGYQSSTNWDKALSLRTNYQTKLIALGGINAQRLQSLSKMNLDGVALLGTIWCDDQGIKNFKSCLQTDLSCFPLQD